MFIVFNIWHFQLLKTLNSTHNKLFSSELAMEEEEEEERSEDMAEAEMHETTKTYGPVTTTDLKT